MFDYYVKKEKDASLGYVPELNFNELKKLVLSDDYGIWKEHIRLRKRFEVLDDHLASVAMPSIKEAKQRGYETVFKALDEFSKHGELKFSPSHGIGHAMRDYLHALVLAGEDKDPREAYIRIVAGTLHDILGCSLVERYDESDRSIRHAEASALLFLWISKNIGMGEDEIIPIYYTIAAHTNYMEDMAVTDSEGRVRKIEAYKKYYNDGWPIYFLHGAQEVDRLDIISPCGFLRHYLGITEVVGREHYFSPIKKFFLVDYKEHMRPLFRPIEEINLDISGATLREILFAMADTQKDGSTYACGDGKKMVEMRDLCTEMTFHILQAFDNPIVLSVQEKDALFLKFNNLISERIEPTEDARKVVINLQEMFLSLPFETQKSWFSVFMKVLEEYEIWRNIFQKEVANIPRHMLSLPVLGRVDRIIY